MKTNKISRLIRRTRKNSIPNKKGFTLVELIVVLVILAILAAVAIPVMLGFTDSAKEKKYIEEANRALTAAQTMLSDVYTDNLKYVPRKMRIQAEVNADLPGSEFIIYTVSHFKTTADGTAESISAYTIAAALYKTSDGQYLYYDGNVWEMIDSGDSHVLQARSGNYIDVWPSSEYLTDSAGNAEKNENQGSEEGEAEYTTEDDGQEHDDNTEVIEEEEEVSPTLEGRSVEVILQSDDKSVFFGKEGEFSITTTFSENKGFKKNPNAKVNTVYYDLGSIAYTIGDEQPMDISKVVSYLYKEVKKLDPEDTSVPTYTFHVSADENTISIPVSFRAFNDDNLTVSVPDNEGSNTVTVEYGMKSGIKNADRIRMPNVDGKNNATFDNIWYAQTGQGNITAENETATNLTELKSVIENWVETNLNTISEGTLTVTQIEENGISFVATADIGKSLYVRGKLNSSGTYVGDVTFGNGSGEVLMLHKDFVQNEMTKDYFPVVGGVKGSKISFTGTNAYSLFSENPILVDGNPLASSQKKIKYWKLFRCEQDYEAGDDIVDTQKSYRGKDCSEELLKQLYVSGGFGEVAEIDVSATTTKLDSEISTGDTALKTAFSGLVGGDFTSISSIIFTSSDNPQRFDERDKEVCISTTGVLPAENPEFAGQLEYDGTRYVSDPDDIDPNFPAYTVAYRVKGTNNKYIIYVVTEDDSDMKAVGSYDSLHSGWRNMTENSFVSHLDTSDVTSMQYMFGTCKYLTTMNIDQFDYSKVTSMSHMFDGCESLTFGCIRNVKPALSSGVNCSNMFKNCKAFTYVNPFDITYASNISNLFDGCTGLKGVVLSGSGESVPCNLPNTEAENKNVFTNDAGTDGFTLTIRDIKFNKYSSTKDAKTTGNSGYKNGLYFLIRSAKNATRIEFNNVSMPNVYSIEFLFAANTNTNEKIADALKTAKDLQKVEQINLINVDAPIQRMKAVFRLNDNLQKVIIRNCNMSWLWNLSWAFQGCGNLKMVEFGEGFTTYGSHAKQAYAKKFDYMFDFNRLFERCHNLTTIVGMDEFDTSNAKSMKYMFDSCYSLTSIDISNFVTSQMTALVDKENPFLHMFWTENVSGKTESALTTIYASEGFVPNDPNIDMFGSKLTHLKGGNGTTMSSLTTNKSKATYAWIDGRTGRTDTRGYFTDSSLRRAKLAQTNGNWLPEALGSETYKSVTSFGKSTGTFASETQFRNECWSTIADNMKFECYDSTFANVGVFFWLEGTNLYWWSEAGTVYINENTSNMFYGWEGLTSVDLTGLNTLKMSSMALMFYGCTNLESLELNMINTLNVTTMERMFYDCNALASVDLTGFDTSRVRSMKGMFGSSDVDHANNLVTIDLSSFETNSLTTIQGMFERCTSLTTIYVDPSQWTDRTRFGSESETASGGDVFLGCGSLTGGNGTSASTTHGVKVADVYPEVTEGADTDLYQRAYYAICDEAEKADLNRNYIMGEDGYFTDVAQKTAP